MIKAVLFDMDGVLIDSEKHYTDGTYEWLVDNGYKGDMTAAYGTVGLTMEQTYRYIEKISGLQNIRESYDRYFVEHPLDFKKYLFADVKDTLISLKNKGIRTALCSMSSRKLVESFLLECDLKEYFEVVLSSDDVNEAKPSPLVYLTALDKLQLKPEEVIVVEDSTNGIKAGKNAGCIVFARNGERFNIDQKEADRIIDNIRILGEII